MPEPQPFTDVERYHFDLYGYVVRRDALEPDEIDGEVLTVWEDWVGCDSLKPMPRPSIRGESVAQTPLDLAARRPPRGAPAT